MNKQIEVQAPNPLVFKDGFWRKGNVDIVCERYNIKQVNNFEDLILEVKSIL